MSTGIRKLFDELRGIEVAVIHPAGSDCNVLVDQLKRIGCRVKPMWPCPAVLPPDMAVVFLYISGEQGLSARWSASDAGGALIALVDYENPTVLKGLLETNAHAVISKPFRPTGVLSTLVLARSVHGYEQRLLSKVSKLEETLRSRRVIERAVKLLAERRSLNDVEAYDHIRRQATNKRISIVEVASMIINASDVLDGMGPINR
jgi:AmiR/NasT family two-component response regulator